MVNTRAAHIGALLALRGQCIARGDHHLAAEIDADLRRQGYDPTETAAAPTDTVEIAMPPRPRRGRPPKIRSEYPVAGRDESVHPPAADSPGQYSWSREV